MITNEYAPARILLTEDREKIATLAKAASASERMLVENHSIHDFFFSHIRWSPEENRAQSNGFYIDTLELQPAELKGFKMLRHWGAARVLRRVGVGKKVAEANEKTYSTASAMIAIVVATSSPRDLIAAGRAAERVWLSATARGLSVQPSTGALFLAEGAKAGNAEHFSAAQRKLLAKTRSTIYAAFGLDQKNEHVAMLLRVGHAEPPSARAARFPIDHFFKKTAHPPMTDRIATIDAILQDLERLKNDPHFENQYAVDENIRFFKATKYYPEYLRWIIHHAPKIDAAELLEITDMPFPRWDREMHQKLVELEQKDFPGLVTPLVAPPRGDHRAKTR